MQRASSAANDYDRLVSARTVVHLTVHFGTKIVVRNLRLCDEDGLAEKNRFASVSSRNLLGFSCVDASTLVS